MRQGKSIKGPSSVAAYNYVIWAQLQEGNRRDAFETLREMEEERGWRADMHTFELIMWALARDGPSHALTVEEMAAVMAGPRYGLQASRMCWLARIRAWLERKPYNNEAALQRPIQLVTEMNAVYPLENDRDAMVQLIKMTVQTDSWPFADYIFTAFPKACDQICSEDWQRLLDERFDIYPLLSLPFLRHVFQRIDGLALEEGLCVRMLNVAARLGDAAADIGWLALSHLVQLYRSGPTESQIPTAYLDAFKLAITTSSDGQLDPLLRMHRDWAPLTASRVTEEMREFTLKHCKHY